MTASDAPSWRSVFVGRDEELLWLQAAWEDAAAGRPRLRVLRGESGLGKTRIVQALYAWLSRPDVADPHAYWPDTLAAGDNLRLNPDPDRQPLGERMAYLWWGLRWTPPDARNQGELTHCAFFDQRQMLHPHWEQLTHFKDTAAATVKLGGALGSAALGLARDAAVALFPLLGLVKLATDVGGAVLGIGTAARDLGTEVARLSKPPAVREAEALAEQVDQVVAFLRWVLRPFHRSGSGSMPVVLVLDDAQWIDERSAEVVERLFREATEAGWPLLVVATHWEREWYEQTATAEEQDAEQARTAARSFPALYASLAASDAGGACEIRDVARLEGGDEVLRAAFPGLTSEQREAIAARADGNPRLLAEIILYLESEPDLFEDADPQGPLEPMAIDELDEEMAGFELQRLQERRYRRLPPAIREALALASLQGMRFLAELTQDLESRVALRPPEEYAGSLERAELPHAIVSSRGLEREFRFVLFRDLALRYLERLCKRHSLEVTTLRDAMARTADSWLGTHRYAALSDSERENLLLVLLDPSQRAAPLGIRGTIFAVEHYQRTGNARRAAELLQDWQTRVGDRMAPFSAPYTRLEVAGTPFLPGWVVFRLTDYDGLPALPLHYATDGSTFELLDGSAEALARLIGAAGARVGAADALAYLRFFLSALYHVDGTTRLVEGSNIELPAGPYGAGGTWTDAEPAPPVVRWDPGADQGRIEALVAHRGSLFEATFAVGRDGRITVEAQSWLRTLRPRCAHVYWRAWDELDEETAEQGFVPSDDPQTTLELDGAVRPPLDPASARTLVAEGVRILASAPECDGPELVQPLLAGDVSLALLDTPREITFCSMDGSRCVIGLPRYRPVTQDRVTLLLADVLIEASLDRDGKRPTIADERDAWVHGIAERKAAKVAHLCAFAYDLSLRPDPGVGDLQAELRAMGHGRALDVFLQAVTRHGSGP